MGEVWRARDTRLGREVAVKVLAAAAAATPAAKDRFAREARAVAALAHPNVVALHDFGEHDGRPYAVSELVAGSNLRERLREGPVPPRRAAEWTAQAARGLAAAHAAAIVHRDVKPENLILSRDGRLKVLDFGLARQQPGSEEHHVAAGLHLTVPGMIMGTVGYMSPEQVRGEIVDHRSDIFSLGCVLYELLAGEAPFARATMPETMVAILHEDPPPIATTRSRSGDAGGAAAASGATSGGAPAAMFTPVPATLERIVHHCLEKNPAERFQNALDLAFALDGLSGETSAALPAPTDELATPPAAAPRRGWRAAGGLLALGLAGGLAVGVWLGVRGRGEPPPPSKLRAMTYAGRDSWPAASPDGALVAFASERDGRSRIWLRQMAGGDEVALTEGTDTFPRFAPDGGSILFARQREGPQAGSDLWRVSTVGGEPRRVLPDAVAGDWSPAGDQVAFVRERAGDGWQLGVLPLGAGSERVLYRDRLRLEHPRWSPDGGRLAVLRSGSVRGPDAVLVVDVASGTASALALPGVVWSLAWNGEDELLYALAEGAGARLPSSQLLTRRLGSGRTRTLLWLPFTVPNLEPLGAGSVVVTALQRRQNLWETAVPIADTGGHWLSRGSSVDRQPVYSPDGRWVAFASTRGGNLDVWRLELVSGEVHRLTDHAAEDWDPAFTPDGRHLLWSSNRSGHFEVWIAEPDGSSPRQLSQDGFDAENPTAGSDGWVVYASSHPEKGGIWRLRHDGSAAERLVAGVENQHPEASPDGAWIVYHLRRGGFEELHAVRTADGAALPLLSIPLSHPRASRFLNELSLAVGRARWRPDGTAVLYVGFDGEGRAGIFELPFPPLAAGRAAAAPRPVLLSDEEAVTETFALSADGRRMVVSFREQAQNLMLAEGVPGLVGRSPGRD